MAERSPVRWLETGQSLCSLVTGAATPDQRLRPIRARITQSFGRTSHQTVPCDVTGRGSRRHPTGQLISLRVEPNPTATAIPARAARLQRLVQPPGRDLLRRSVLVLRLQSRVRRRPFTVRIGANTDRQRLPAWTTLARVRHASYTLNYDATPPTMMEAMPSRPPDHNGWYNHPVSFAFSGTDSISGIASCSRPTYSGPDTASAVVTGNCTDRAGNVATLPISLSYDSTPPTLDASASPGDGIVNLNWNATESVAPVTSVQIARSPRFNSATTSALHRGHSGSFRDTSVRNWVTYKYTIQAWDQAGNETIRTITVTPGPRLLGPANGARLTTPPTLRWTPIHSATYYNVQLFRGDGKVLSMWPAHAKLQLTRRWHFGGHLRRLKPGKYRWYVWPGYGRRSAARYGSMVGKGTFVVTSPKSTAASNVVYPAMRMLAPDAGR